MYISGFSPCCLENGPGARVAIFVSGCTMHCKNCYSPSTWDRYNGVPFDDEYKRKVFDALSSPYCAGLSLLGGDPLEPYNVDEVTALAKEVKEKFPEKTIWLWTGRKKEKVQNYEIMKYVDVVISDPYIDHLNTNNTKYRGSSNQRVWWAKTGAEYMDENLVNEHCQNKYVQGNKV